MESIRFFSEGITIFDEIEKMIWQDGIDSNPIAETVDQHTFLITFVRGERKNKVKRNDIAVRVYLCF